jgi:hypothetical protein
LRPPHPRALSQRSGARRLDGANSGREALPADFHGRGLATALGARGSPMTVVYDSSGQIVHVTFGGMTRTQLEAKIRAVLGG